MNEGNRPRHQPPLSQLVEWQRKLNKAAETASVELVRLSAGAKAWVELEKQKRAMKMQPVPRPVDVTELRRAKVKPLPGPD